MANVYLNINTDLRQGGKALLLDVPHELVARELQALLHVQLGHVDADQQPALLRTIALHYSSHLETNNKMLYFIYFKAEKSLASRHFLYCYKLKKVS